MICKAPNSAQTVLSRISPASQKQRRDWLLLSWQAANESLDHSRASLALRRLANGNYTVLNFEQLKVGYREDGIPLTRSALDLLAEHELALNRSAEAATVLLANRDGGSLGARRLALAAKLLQGLGNMHYSKLMESALEQAAADQAWGLAEDLLRLQLKLDLDAGGDGSLPRRRLERLARKLNDRYTLWELIKGDLDQEGTAIIQDKEQRSSQQHDSHVAVDINVDRTLISAPSESK